MPIKGIVHVGGHWAEENEEYFNLGVKDIVYVEPCREAFEIMVTRVIPKLEIKHLGDAKEFTWDGHLGHNVKFFNCACGAEETELPMHISKQNQGQSNSFLKSHLHSVQHPEILFTETQMMKVVPLDTLPFEKEKYNILVMDTEGFEGEVLKGAEETLKNIDLIYSEVNKAATRIGNILIEDLEEYLWQRDFVMIQVYWPSPTFTWGDAVFIRKSFINA